MLLGNASEVTQEEVAEEAKTWGGYYVIDARINRTKRATLPSVQNHLCAVRGYAL